MSSPGTRGGVEDCERRLQASQKEIIELRGKVVRLEWQVKELQAQLGQSVQGTSAQHPKTVFVVGSGSCDGTYRLSGEIANWQPVWKNITQNRWLFSGLSGQWVIGGEAECRQKFQCDTGSVATRDKHQGKLPQHIGPGKWMRYEGNQWHGVPALNLIATGSSSITAFLRVQAFEIGGVLSANLRKHLDRELQRIYFESWMKSLWKAQLKEFMRAQNEEVLRRAEVSKAANEVNLRTRLWSAMGPFLARCFSVWYFEVAIEGPLGIKTELRDRHNFFCVRIYRLRNRMVGLLAQAQCWRIWVVYATQAGREFDQLGPAEYAFWRMYEKTCIIQAHWAWKTAVVQGRMLHRVKNQNYIVEDIVQEWEYKVKRIQNSACYFIGLMTRFEPRKLALIRCFGNWAAAVRWQLEAASVEDKERALLEELADLRIQMYGTNKAVSRGAVASSGWEESGETYGSRRGPYGDRISHQDRFSAGSAAIDQRALHLEMADMAHRGYTAQESPSVVNQGYKATESPTVANQHLALSTYSCGAPGGWQVGSRSDLWAQLKEMEGSIEAYGNRTMTPIRREEAANSPQRQIASSTTRWPRGAGFTDDVSPRAEPSSSAHPRLESSSATSPRGAPGAKKLIL